MIGTITEAFNFVELSASRWLGCNAEFIRRVYIGTWIFEAGVIRAGKVKKITFTGGHSPSSLEFIYDPMGNRIGKIETPSGGGTQSATFYSHDASGNVMATYDLRDKGAMDGNLTSGEFSLNEVVLYGSSRLGTVSIGRPVDSLTAHQRFYFEEKANRRYELTNHLGNVMAVISGETEEITFDTETVTMPRILFSTDYYPFGMEVANSGVVNNTAKGEYRFGFHGQEKDDEIKGDGNSINYKYPMHFPRIGRFFAVDPLAAKYPWNSPYAFSENKVIAFIELEGLEAWDIKRKWMYADIQGFSDFVQTEIKRVKALEATGEQSWTTLYACDDVPVAFLVRYAAQEGLPLSFSASRTPESYEKGYKYGIKEKEPISAQDERFTSVEEFEEIARRYTNLWSLQWDSEKISASEVREGDIYNSNTHVELVRKNEDGGFVSETRMYDDGDGKGPEEQLRVYTVYGNLTDFPDINGHPLILGKYFKDSKYYRRLKILDIEPEQELIKLEPRGVKEVKINP